MASTINMAQALLEQGRALWEQDRYDEATQVLSRLLRLRRIPRGIAERAQFYLGDMHLAQGHYPKARRHLAAAIATGTDCGETHFLMARALDWDDEGDPHSAYDHYRRATDLDPGQPLYSSSYALMRIRQRKNRSAAALTRLRDAFGADPDDPDIVYNYVCGLMDLGRSTEAELALRRARKTWPGHPMFEELWYDLLTARGMLRCAPGGALPAPPPPRPAADQPVLLPFPGLAKRAPAPAALRPNARLRTALETLGARDVARLGRILGIPATGSTAEQRDRIRRALLNPNTLRTLVQRLSVDSRRLIRSLQESGGMARKRLRGDGPAAHRPHFAAAPTLDSLDELRRTGLVFPTHAASERERFMIPSDLRKLLGEAMA
jgi:tetratricopeptide (TPR) repeat protein